MFRKILTKTSQFFFLVWKFIKKEIEAIMEDIKKETQELVEEMKEKIDNNLTISTKLSTEQLICKTPQESPSASLKCNKDALPPSSSSNAINIKPKINNVPKSSIIYWANLQILFGILMIVAGGFVIYYKASLYQVSDFIDFCFRKATSSRVHFFCISPNENE